MFKNFQYFSDIHTEFFSEYDLKIFLKIYLESKADYLIIAGDIGNPFSIIYSCFLKIISSKFKKIFIITGNHEYYSEYPMNKVDEKISKIVLNYSNIVFLQNSVYNIEDTDLTIFGSTLWSNVEENTLKNLNDFRKIPNFSFEIYHNLHYNAIKFLEKYLNEHKNKKFIVITHHLPSFSLVDNKEHLINSAYASNISIAESSQIVAWFAGHTHRPIELGKFHVNPIGYPNENTFFDLNKIVKIFYDSN